MLTELCLLTQTTGFFYVSKDKVHVLSSSIVYNYIYIHVQLTVGSRCRRQNSM